MNRTNPQENERPVRLDELPSSSRTINIGDRFMISDNIRFYSDDDRRLVSNAISLFNMPLKFRFTMMLLCVDGYMRIRYRMNEYTVSKYNLLITLEGSTGECLEMSDDARFIMMSVSKDLNIPDIGLKPITENIAALTTHPLITLDEEEADNIISIYTMLRSRLKIPGFKMAEELAISCMRTIFYYISQNFETELKNSRGHQSRKEILLDRFMQMVEEHGGTQRKISYYADRLCITEKYLSKIVSELTGNTPREWISIRVIMEAKALLSGTDHTIAMISELLGFPNQSFFGTFFKRYTGYSPLRYRTGAQNR